MEHHGRSAPIAAVAPSIPLEITERMMLAVRDIVDLHIRCGLVFDHMLDEDRLQESFCRLAVRYPFLGMRVDQDRDWPAFVPLGRDVSAEWIDRMEAEDFEAYLAGPHDCFTQPQLRMGLHPTNDGGTRAAFIASHMAVDAAGMRQCMRELGVIYTALGKGNEPELGEPPFRRDPALVVLPRNGRGLAARLASLRLFYRLAKPSRSLCPVLPAGEGPALAWRRENWQGRDLMKLKAVARSEGGTLNDLFAAVILTAVARLHPEHREAAARITLTADLRRFVPDHSLLAPANVSNVLTLTVARRGATDWRAMLRGTVAETGRLKKYGMGLQGASMVQSMAKFTLGQLEERLRRHNRKAVQTGAVPTAMTNLGQLMPEDATFDSPPTTAVMFPPPMFSPRSLFSLSGYRNTLCLALPIFSGTENAVERLMNEVQSVAREVIAESISQEEAV